MEKENQRIKLTKRLLREALLRLLEKKTIDKINITELCNEAGINRATFYRHYAVPADVLLDIEMEFVEKVNAAFDITATHDITGYLEGLCSYLYDNSELVKIFVSNNSEEDFTVLINNIFSGFIK
ncbi:MAG: TetR/AcrR family transcriptional regulator [Clostridia bacterium]|nr:TetR/AcrR family transcriptional regulator [Clostridia bacterium]